HGVMYGLGEARRTTFKILDPAGNALSGSCTLAEIVCDGGDADKPGEITVKIRFNGKPVYTPA
ncbi:MAG: capsid protein, partial [Clostridia bacterium]|nr:capsid protein [Clostridia bacterium]